ncbi:hypothetical protein ACROYT_G014821 [Oculina patagonica]
MQNPPAPLAKTAAMKTCANSREEGSTNFWQDGPEWLFDKEKKPSNPVTSLSAASEKEAKEIQEVHNACQTNKFTSVMVQLLERHNLCHTSQFVSSAKTRLKTLEESETSVSHCVLSPCEVPTTSSQEEEDVTVNANVKKQGGATCNVDRKITRNYGYSIKGQIATGSYVNPWTPRVTSISAVNFNGLVATKLSMFMTSKWPLGPPSGNTPNKPPKKRSRRCLGIPKKSLVFNDDPSKDVLLVKEKYKGTLCLSSSHKMRLRSFIKLTILKARSLLTLVLSVQRQLKSLFVSTQN